MDAHLEQALLELRTLQRVAWELSQSLDLDVVLGRCLELAIEAAHASGGVIYLYDAARESFHRVVAHGTDDDTTPPMLPVTPELMRLLMTSSFLLDMTADSPRPRVTQAYEAGIRRALVLALRTDQLVGFIALQFRGAAPSAAPSPSTTQTLEAIARHEAIAISNARAHQLVERRGRMADGLREFSERALACSTPGDLYQLILEIAVKLTRNQRGLIANVNGDHTTIVATMRENEDLLGLEIPVTTPYLGEVLASPTPVVCEDASQLDPDSLFGQLAQRRKTASYLMTAVRNSERPVGVVYVGSSNQRHYEPEEREALQILATVAGEALERVRALEQMGVEKRRVDGVLEHLPIVVSVIGPGGEMLHLNAAGRAFAEQFGTQGNWRDAMQRVQTLHPDGKPVESNDLLIARAFAGEQPPPREIVVVAPDGRRRHVLSVAAPLRRADGSVEAVVTGFQDVTSLRELADAKDHFLRVASHELRSPLTSLRATTSLLEMDPTAVSDPERRAVMLERVHRQVDRLTRLVEQLIDSVRLNATEPTLERSETDLGALCHEVIDAMAGGARVRLVVDGPVRGQWDALRLEQVVSNLVSNAARYSPLESEIEVRVGCDGAHATIKVTDHGIGIPLDQRERLFTPFFRASNAAAQSKGGLGLGLHIAAEIVRRHGGTLTVRSEPGHGSTFVVDLPLS